MRLPQHFEIDLRAKQLSNDVRIWRMFPGEEYKFFEDFLLLEGVFLDLPGFNMPQVPAKDIGAQMRERLALSRATEKWIAEDKAYLANPAGKTAPVKPDTDLNVYKAERHVRNSGKVIGAIASLFDTADKGDLIVVPNRGFTREILVGEFIDAPHPRRTIIREEFTSDVKTAFRRVHWFSPIDEIRIPRAVSNSLRIPVAISLIPQSQYNAIFEVSFGSFLKADEFFTRIRVDNSDFTAQDTIDLGAIAKLAALLSSRVSARLRTVTDGQCVGAAGRPC